MSPSILRLGTRGSALALFQTRQVIESLHQYMPQIQCEEVIIQTTGDQITHKPLRDCGGKNLFSREIHQALRDGRIDMAVHSGKDLEFQKNSDIQVIAVLKRANPADILISKTKNPIRFGTCAPRRAALLRHLYPNCTISSLRGNVPTRIAKLKESEDLDAIVLAAAGIERLNLISEIQKSGLSITELDPLSFIPAAAQGMIAIDCLTQNTAVREILSKINHEHTYQDWLIEKSVVDGIGGNCHTALGVWHHEHQIHTCLEGTKGLYFGIFKSVDESVENLVAGAGFEPTTFRL